MKSLIITFFLLFSVSMVGAEAKTKLTNAEVQKIFIGKSWHNNSGRFIFGKDGTYQYDEFDGSFTYRGAYTLKSNGQLKGKSTSYRFYRTKDGSYLYYHSRSRRFYPAIPD